MSTIDDVHLARWQMIDASIPYVPSFAFPTYFREHPEIGSPIKGEFDLGDGVSAQPFTGGILKYTPGVGVEVVSG